MKLTLLCIWCRFVVWCMFFAPAGLYFMAAHSRGDAFLWGIAIVLTLTGLIVAEWLCRNIKEDMR